MVFLVTKGIDRSFNSLDHSLLLAVLKKKSVSVSVINRIEVMLKKPEISVINSGKTQYIH